MMASTMRCCKNVLNPLLVLLLLVWLPFAAAADVEVRNPSLTPTDDGYALSADFNIDINNRLEESEDRGVVLYFVVEFELNRHRWYWLDDKVASRTLTYRLSYNALTRLYRLSNGALHQNFTTLESALRLLSRLRNWTVLERGSSGLVYGQPYQASVRFRLDTSQLPKPFQLTALAYREWNLGSDWARWNFVPEPREAR